MTGNFTLCVGTVGSGAWTSSDGGENWQRVRSGLWGESRVYGLAVHPREPRTLFAGADDDNAHPPLPIGRDGPVPPFIARPTCLY